MTLTISLTGSDVLAIVVFVIYFKLMIDFAASLKPAPRRKRSGTWTQDDSKR